MLLINISSDGYDELTQAKKEILARLNLSEQMEVPHGPNEQGFLDLMLQSSRILEMNELELYFFRDGDQVHPLSPRNEIQALDRVRQQVASMPATTQVSDLLKFLEASLDSVPGSENAPELYNEGVPCRSAADVALISWSLRSGVECKIQPAMFASTGRGAQCTEDIYPGDVVASIPAHLLLSSHTAMASEMGDVLRAIHGIDDDTKALLWSIHEKQNLASKYAPFFSSLPTNFCTGLSIGPLALKRLVGTSLLEEIMRDRQIVRESYESLFPLLTDAFPEHFPEHVFSWDNFLWSTQLWNAYGIQVLFPEGSLRTCLVPVASLLNHSVYPHVTSFSRLDPSSQSLRLTAVRGCKKGQQCFLSYGALGNSQLVKDYGFVAQSPNPYDVVFVDLDIGSDEQDDNEASIRLFQKKLLRELNLSLDGHMLRDCSAFSGSLSDRAKALPEKVMAALRISVLTEEEYKDVELNPLTKMVSKLNEERALSNLRQYVDALLSGLSSTSCSTDSNEELDPEAHLAMEFVDSFRKILQSVKDLCIDLEIDLVKVDCSNVEHVNTFD